MQGIKRLLNYNSKGIIFQTHSTNLNFEEGSLQLDQCGCLQLYL